MMTIRTILFLVPMLTAALMQTAHAADNTAIPDTSEQAVFATVGASEITRQDYDSALYRAKRSRFYHGKPPEEQVTALEEDVAREMIDRMLLLQEARHRGLKPDEKGIQSQLDQYEQRYAGSARWQEQKATLLPALRQRLEEDSLLVQLETGARRLTPPGRDALVRYYEANPDKFTEPARNRVSLILLTVDPSSPRSVWDAAMEEGVMLVGRLEKGANFAELAHMHSGDASAKNGGDMGYLHEGMLSPAAQEVVNGLDVGDTSEPVRLLEGVAILRLDDRTTERLRAFADIEGRARALWAREAGDQAWSDLKDRLWDETPVKVFDTALNLESR